MSDRTLSERAVFAPFLGLERDKVLLITGVSGFVGQHLARHFVRNGYTVAGTYLTNPVHPEGATTFPLDLSDAGAVRRLVRDMKPTAVVHCASQTNTGWCEKNVAEARASIVEATQNFCEALAAQAPETPFISFSTDLVFGGEEAPYDEEASGKPLNVYGSLKLEAEGAVRRLPCGCVLRSALVYGPPVGSKGSFLGWMLESAVSKGEVPLFMDEWRTAVFVDDLASAVELLLETPGALGEGKVYHAGGPDRLSRLEMGRMMCEVFGLPEDPLRPVRRCDVPGAELRARDVSLKCERLRALNWKPTTFGDGLTACKTRWNS